MLEEVAAVLLSAEVKQRGRFELLRKPDNVDLVVKARIASSHSACELGVMQPLASQSAPLEKVVHANGGEEGGSGGCGGGGGEEGGDGGEGGSGGGVGGDGGAGGEGGHWQAQL